MRGPESGTAAGQVKYVFLFPIKLYTSAFARELKRFQCQGLFLTVAVFPTIVVCFSSDKFSSTQGEDFLWGGFGGPTILNRTLRTEGKGVLK